VGYKFVGEITGPSLFV